MEGLPLWLHDEGHPDLANGNGSESVQSSLVCGMTLAGLIVRLSRFKFRSFMMSRIDFVALSTDVSSAEEFVILEAWEMLPIDAARPGGAPRRSVHSTSTSSSSEEEKDNAVIDEARGGTGSGHDGGGFRGARGTGRFLVREDFSDDFDTLPLDEWEEMEWCPGEERTI